MCSPKHISKEANYWKKNEGLIPGVGVKGVGMRTILERQGWRGKKETWKKLTGCKQYEQCVMCNNNYRLYNESCRLCETYLPPCKERM